MKFSAKNKDLKAALSRLQALQSDKAKLPITLIADEFGGLSLLRHGALAAMRVECDAVVEDGGEVTVGFEPLRQLVFRVSSPKIEFNLTDKLKAVAGTSKSDLVVWPPGEFGSLIPEVSGTEYVFESSKLMELIRVAAYATFRSPGRENLHGVGFRTCLGKLTFLGSDGRRIHAAYGDDSMETIYDGHDENGNPLTYDAGIMLSNDILPSIEKLLSGDSCPAKMKIGQNSAQIECAGRWLRFLLPKDAPNDMTIFLRESKYDISARVNREEFKAIVKAATSIGDNSSHRIDIRFEKMGVHVDSKDASGNTHTDFVHSAPSKFGHTASANGQYVIDLLESMSQEEVELGWLKDFHALVCREPDRYVILMGMR